MKFKGSIADLKDKLLLGGLEGYWEHANNKHVLKTEDGAVLNFYPTTGTVHVQGKMVAKLDLENKLALILDGPAIERPAKKVKKEIETANSFDELLDKIEHEDYPPDYVPWIE